MVHVYNSCSATTKYTDLWMQTYLQIALAHTDLLPSKFQQIQCTCVHVHVYK